MKKQRKPKKQIIPKQTSSEEIFREDENQAIPASVSEVDENSQSEKSESEVERTTSESSGVDQDNEQANIVFEQTSDSPEVESIEAQVVQEENKLETKIKYIEASCVCSPAKPRVPTNILVERNNEKLEKLNDLVLKIKESNDRSLEDFIKLKDTFTLVAALAGLNFMALIILIISIYKP